ncbi:MAG: hybrid sensor histidine kinase/response regulator [Polyangiaceae bacterium]|nr:hybrid sensor histidine kinase/response regulator [Polyangiaceae bacterium]
MTPPPRDEAPSILVVDDNPRNLLALVAALEDLGVRIATATTGEEALRRVLERDFAAILLDVHLPGLDGFETARLIRSRPRCQATPILFQTAWETDDATLLSGYSVGAVDYVVKPVNPLVLRSKVAVFLELHRRATALERKNLELDLAREQAERASQAKTRFLASASHELRTPLGGIVGFAGLLERTGPLTAPQEEHVRRILECAHHLTALVDDLLDLSKIEVGKLRLERRWTTLASLADNVVGALGPVAAAAGVTVLVEIPEDYPRLYVDALRMRQVLFNLVSNAIKHSAPHTTAKLRGFTAPGVAGFAVEDEGPGIAEAHRSTVFEEFEPLQPDRERRTGTGLGLAVARRLVELHHGSIEVVSLPAGGVAFTVRLPSRRQPSLPDD